MTEGVDVAGARERPVVDRLVCHPRLPLVAGLDRYRPAVHLWDVDDRARPPRHVACVGEDRPPYDLARPWTVAGRTPSVTWHRHDPLLLVATEYGLMRWTPAALTPVEGPAGTAPYRHVAFDRDGRTVWVSPTRHGEDRWDRCDAIDLETGAESTGPRWDTGLAPHPGGDLAVTLASDQGATLVLFAQIDRDQTPATLRVLRRALVLDDDGYQAPLISPDGRHLAVRGNAYDNSLQIFEFPSLRQVLATALGDPSPGYPYPPEWIEQRRSWSPHALAFAPNGTLLLGTPAGAVVEIDVGAGTGRAHAVLRDEPVAALAVTATGDVLVAGRRGSFETVPGVGGGTGDPTAATDLVAAFVAATSPAPEGADLDRGLDVTDGIRDWTDTDLRHTTTAHATGPGWLQLLALVNTAHATKGAEQPSAGNVQR